MFAGFVAFIRPFSVTTYPAVRVSGRLESIPAIMGEGRVDHTLRASTLTFMLKFRVAYELEVHVL